MDTQDLKRLSDIVIKLENSEKEDKALNILEQLQEKYGDGAITPLQIGESL